MSDTIFNRRVKDVMSRDVVSVHSGDSIHEALNLMVENRVSALPVVDGRNHCIGIISTTDLVDLTRDVDDDVNQMEELDPSSRRWLIDKLVNTMGTEKLDSYMTENVATVSSETLLARAAREMLRNRVHHLPVVDSQERLIGIISTMDILAVFAAAATP